MTLTTGTGPGTGILFTWPGRGATEPAYGIVVSGRNVAGRTVVANGIAQSSGEDTLACPVGIAVGRRRDAHLFNVIMRDA